MQLGGQDNDPKHTSDVVKELLNQATNEVSNPDLNPSKSLY